METKQPVDLLPEPDLQEHRRLIDRARARNAAPKMADVDHEAGAPRGMMLVSAGVLLVAALIVAGMVLLQ